MESQKTQKKSKKTGSVARIFYNIFRSQRKLQVNRNPLTDMGGYGDDLYDLASDYLCENDTLPPGFESEYGNMPADIKCQVDMPCHYWIFYKGKHYDSETPDGVENFLDLPIFRRALERTRMNSCSPTPRPNNSNARKITTIQPY